MKADQFGSWAEQKRAAAGWKKSSEMKGDPAAKGRRCKDCNAVDFTTGASPRCGVDGAGFSTLTNASCSRFEVKS